MIESRLFVDLDDAKGLKGATVYDADAAIIGEITDVEADGPGKFRVVMRIYDTTAGRAIRDGIYKHLSVSAELIKDD